MTQIDFGLTAHDYAQHRAGFPDSLFDRLIALGIAAPGQMVVDLGTGAGTLARGFARRGCRVIGIDPSEPLLAQAKFLSEAEGLSVEFRMGKAESTGLESSSVDGVTAGSAGIGLTARLRRERPSGFSNPAAESQSVTSIGFR